MAAISGTSAMAFTAVAQSSGKCVQAIKTADKVIDFTKIAGTAVAGYAASKGLQTAAVDLAIKKGVKIVAGGKIAIAITALELITAAIKWYIEHNKVTTTPVEIININGLGPFRFASIKQADMAQFTSGQVAYSGDVDGNPATGGNNEYNHRRIKELFEKYNLNSNSYPFVTFDCKNRDDAYKKYVNTIKFDINKYTELRSSVLSSKTQIYLDFAKANRGPISSPRFYGYSPLPDNPLKLWFFLCTRAEDNILYWCRVFRSENPQEQDLTRKFYWTFFIDEAGGTRQDVTRLNTWLNSQGEEVQRSQYSASVKNRTNSEYIVLPPKKVLVINPGAATIENPNPDFQQIYDHMAEQLAQQNQAGFEYAPPHEFEDVEAPIEPAPEAPADIPLTPPKTPIQPPSDPIKPPAIPPLSGVSGGISQIFTPSEAELKLFANYLVSPNVFDNIVKLFADPADYIVSLAMMPCNLELTKKVNPYIGNVMYDGTMWKVEQQYSDIDFGEITVAEEYKSFLDYNSQVSIFLPFIGERPLNVDDVMNSTLSLKYRIDILTGVCVAMLHVKQGEKIDAVLYQWEGNVSANIPLRTSQWDLDLGSLVGGAVAGGSLGFATSVFTGTMKPRVGTVGNLTGNAGFLGVQTPFLTITRPRTATPSNHTDINGGANTSVQAIGKLTGFVQVKDCKFDGIPCTTEEMEEIKTALEGGVYL